MTDLLFPEVPIMIARSGAEGEIKAEDGMGQGMSGEAACDGAAARLRFIGAFAIIRGVRGMWR